jgi:hypothetical protein
MFKGKVFPVFQPHFFSPRWQILNEEIDCTEEEMMLFAALQLQVSKSINAVRQKINLFWSFKLGSFLFFQVAMQANVPQPAADEDDGDDVDEGRWRHDSSGSSLKQKSLIVFITIFEPRLHLML